MLDTWFSSGLWPFSTMGWGANETGRPNGATEWAMKNAPDYKKFYPTTTLVTGFDIIFFWVARMITMGLEFTDAAPFSTVYIHGLIRDEKGQKMSKSKGNTLDPVVLIDKYGCDALRFTLTSLCTYGGQDIKISDERFEYGRNFANKIWNAAQFVLMNLEGVDDKPFQATTLPDHWILDKLNSVAGEVNKNMKDFRLGENAHVLYDFFWNDFCDWYVEIAKIQLGDEALKANTQRVLRYVLDMTMRLLHPIMPHLTEEIWSQLEIGPALIVAEFPQYREDLVFAAEAKQMELVFETIRTLRNVRQSFNIATSVKFDIMIEAAEDERPVFEAIEAYIKRLAKVESISYDVAVPKQSASAVVSASKIVIPLAGLIDLEVELARQKKKLEKLAAEKSGLEGRLNNESFKTNKPDLWEQTRARVEEITLQEGSIAELIKSLNA